MKVLIRADGSPSIGGGHLARTIAVGHALQHQGVDVLLGTRAGAPSELIESACFRITMLPALQTELAFGDLVRAEQPDCILVDHYGLGEEWENEYVGSSFVVALEDGLERSHRADLVVFPGPTVRFADLRWECGERTVIESGPSLALLRPEFAVRARPNTAEHTLYVSFGAADPEGYNVALLRALRMANIPRRFSILVAIASGSQTEGALRAEAKLWGARAEVLVNADIGTVLDQASVAVGAGGVSAWERCAKGVASVVLPIAENQRPVALELARGGAAIVVENIEDAVSEVCRLLDDDALCNEIAQRASSLCDGLGAERLATIICDGINERSNHPPGGRAG